MLVVIVGGTGCGKSSVEKELIDRYGYKRMVSVTTRDMRYGEVDGEDYWFVPKECFLDMVKKGKFIEYTEYNGNYYGTLAEYADKKDECYVAVVTPSGFRKLKEYYKAHNGDFVSIYLDVDEKTRAISCLQKGSDVLEVANRVLIDRGLFERIEGEVDHVVHNINFRLSPTEIATEIYEKRYDFSESSS